MAESEALKTLRATIGKYLKESFGTYLKDQNDNYIIQAGSARIFIIPVDWIKDQTLVRILTVINKNTQITAELTKFLAVENMNLLFGKFSIDLNRQTVCYDHTLLGDFLNRKELEVAIRAFAFIADKYDDEIQAKFGGKKYGEM
jgi:hypothetical protein